MVGTKEKRRKVYEDKDCLTQTLGETSRTQIQVGSGYPVGNRLLTNHDLMLSGLGKRYPPLFMTSY